VIQVNLSRMSRHKDIEIMEIERNSQGGIEYAELHDKELRKTG